MVLLVLIALGIAALLAATLALVATQLRQRSTIGQEEDPIVGEQRTEPLKRSNPPTARAKAIPTRSSPLYVALLLTAATGYYFWTRQGSSPSYKTCTAAPSASKRLKLFANLYGFHCEVFTTSSEAQSLFDQGLLLSWNFNQVEAEVAFRMALEADANMSMAQWGIQYAVGPGANRAVLPERPLYPAFAPDNFPVVREAAVKSLQLAEKAATQQPGSATTARDLAFARAAVLRWPEGSAFGAERDASEVAYSHALKLYGEEHKDAAALAMAAEALMNLHPWDYYQESGKMKDTSEEAEQLILAALELDPDNPLANHLLIHISEASSPMQEAPLSAARGLRAANRLAHGNGPWQAHQGHLLHMPSHTYVRSGRYHDAVVSNINAYNADLFFAQNCMHPYEPEHNTDLLIFAASLGGQVKMAEEFAFKIRKYGSAMFMEDPAPGTSNWAKFPLLLAHFARWNEILKLEKPGHDARANCPNQGFEFSMTIWRYIRVLALAARADGARLSGSWEEFKQLDSYLDTYLQLLKPLLQEAESKVDAEEPVYPPAVYMCEHRGLAEIYLLTAEARVAFLHNQTKEAIAKLTAAVAIEDNFAYMEPPRVYQPVRQCLGYVLLQDRQLEAAEKVYQRDLEIFPDNGWSLHGLSASLHEQGRHPEVKELQQRLLGAWQYADVQVDSSCLVFSRPWGAPAE